MPEASEQPDKKATAKQLFGKGLIGILIVAMAAAVFFVFYVSPQSQYERDRIYRSMNDVSRLLDDKTQAAEQTFRTWNCARDSIADHASCYADFGSKISQVEQDAKAELPGFAFGCTRKNIVCLGSDRNLEAPDSRLKHASVSLDAIAQGARPPYREAILLIMNADGQVV